MVTGADPSSTARLALAAGRHAALAFLLLFGSRARGDAHGRSDWDFAYVAGPGLDAVRLASDLADVLATDRVDLVDLRPAGGLLRFRAARDGRLVFEAEPGSSERFRIEACTFWCDAGRTLQQAYQDFLETYR